MRLVKGDYKCYWKRLPSMIIIDNENIARDAAEALSFKKSRKCIDLGSSRAL